MCAYWGIKATSAQHIKPAHVGLAAPFPEGSTSGHFEILEERNTTLLLIISRNCRRIGGKTGSYWRDNSDHHRPKIWPRGRCIMDGTSFDDAQTGEQKIRNFQPELWSAAPCGARRFAACSGAWTVRLWSAVIRISGCCTVARKSSWRAGPICKTCPTLTALIMWHDEPRARLVFGD